MSNTIHNHDQAACFLLDFCIEPESDRYLDFPRSVRNVTCVSKEQRESNMTVGTPVDLTAKMVSFVQFNMTDLDTGQELLIYSVGVIRPPEQAKDKVLT